MSYFRRSRNKKPLFVLIGIFIFLSVFEDAALLFAATPSVTTSAATSITKATAFLNGVVSGNGGKAITSAGYNYGTTASYGSSASATTSYYYNSFIGSTGSGDAQLLAPYGVAIDSSDNVYVTDSNNHRVKKMDSSGTYISQLGTGSAGTSEGVLDAPFGVAVDSSGNIYVSDTANYRVQKFNSAGVFVNMFGWGVDTGASAFEICTSSCQKGITGSGDGQFAGPIGIEVDASDNVFVADPNNNRIQKFNSSGAYVSKFGSAGTAEGEFNISVNLAFDSGGNIYVTDYNNNRVQKFNSAGVFVNMFGWGVDTGASAFEICTSGCQAGIAGTGNGQFNLVAAIAIDQEDNIYTTETTISNRRVQKFNSSEAYVTKFGSSGTGINQFVFPVGIALDSGGNIYVSDYNTNRVQKFHLLLSSTQITGLSCNTEYHFQAYATNADGTTNGSDATFTTSACNVPTVSTDGATSIGQYIATLNGSYVINTVSPLLTRGFEYGLDTSYGQTFSENGSEYISQFAATGTAGPYDIALDAGSNIYVVDRDGNSIFKFDPSGAPLSQFGSTGTAEGEFSSPTSIAFDSIGNIYVADNSNSRIQKFDSSGVFVSMFGWGVATGASALEVCTSTCQAGLSGSGDGQLGTVFLIDIDSNDDVYVADADNNRVQKFDSSGSFINMFGSGVTSGVTGFEICTSGCQVGLADSGQGEFNYPNAIAIDSNDNIYVGDTNGRAQKLNSSLVYQNEIPTSSTNFTLTVDSNDNVYVSDYGSTIIQKFDSAGNNTSQFGSSGSGDGEFSYPVASAVDASGNIFVVDYFDLRVQKFNLSFDTNISSLSCATQYHYRAFATNPDGAGYGSNATFTTSDCDTSGPTGGCTDPAAVNYDGGANQDDGSCVYNPPRVYGCTNPIAINYNSLATHDDGSCVTVDPPYVLGCTDPDATNYDQYASVDSGLCLYNPGSILGCTDPSAGNYNSSATVDDNSCLYGIFGCMDSTAINYNPAAQYSNNSCTYVNPPTDPILGCTNSIATNYNSSATEDDGTCQFGTPIVYGCMDSTAQNYNADAVEDDGSCTYVTPITPDDGPGIFTEIISGLGGFIKEIPIEVLAPLSIIGLAPGLWNSLLQPGLIAAALLRLWNLIPVLVGYKRKNRPWGTVYDSVTKQPLDPVYVTLKTADGVERGTSITDLDGRYGFLAEAGIYTITANKDNYIFPSAKLAGKDGDELYNNLYFGGDIELQAKEDVIFKNIPMDAINFNWNEFEKARNKKLMKFYSKRDIFLARIAGVLFWSGLVSSVALFTISMSTLNIVILGIYALILVLRLFGVKPKKGGYVFGADGFPLSFGIIRIFSAALGREIAHTIIGKTGKYYALVPNGEYYMKIEKKTGEDSYEPVYQSEPFRVKGGYVGKRIEIKP